jgi:hypothetical protein
MLVMAGVSVLAFNTKAATTYTAGDLILGFRATGGTGASSTVVVDTGVLASTIRDSTSNIASLIDLGSGVGTVLTDTFGANWATRTDIQWGIVGLKSASATAGGVVFGDPKRTVYASEQSTGIAGSAGSTPFDLLNAGNVTAAATAVNDFQSTFASYTGAGATYLGGRAAVIETSLANTFEDNVSTNPNFSTIPGSVVASSASGISGTTLDLYRILGQTGQSGQAGGTLALGSYEGSFNINSSGMVSYTAEISAAPEPSRALLAAIGAGGLLLRRRRTRKV